MFQRLINKGFSNMRSSFGTIRSLSTLNTGIKTAPKLTMFQNMPLITPYKFVQPTIEAGNITTELEPKSPHESIIYTDSVLRKRRLKMKKHKLKKRRKEQRALMKRLGK